MATLALNGLKMLQREGMQFLRLRNICLVSIFQNYLESQMVYGYNNHNQGNFILTIILFSLILIIVVTS